MVDLYDLVSVNVVGASLQSTAGNDCNKVCMGRDDHHTVDV